MSTGHRPKKRDDSDGLFGPQHPNEPEAGGEGKPLPPFLRWAGGKRQILRDLVAFVPGNGVTGTYREPFLGAASLFFRLAPSKAVLSDANEHLIACYKQVRDNPGDLAQLLATHAKKTSESYYYKVRDAYNEGGNPTELAAQFIYLNKTCFNGIFRVNVKGKFNVPYGWKEPPAIPSENELLSASAALKNARLVACDFETSLKDAKKGDIVYLDPPYPPLNGTAYFTHYTKDRFNAEDQEKVAATAKRLTAIGCLVVVSNADTPLIRQLYKGYHIHELSVRRYITCKDKKHRVAELVITSYPKPQEGATPDAGRTKEPE